MNDKTLNLLGLCRRAGKVKIGCDPVIDSVQSKNSRLVLMANNISENTKKKVISIISAVDGTRYEILKYSKDELSFALGKTCAVLSIEDEGFAKKLSELITLNREEKPND